MFKCQSTACLGLAVFLSMAIPAFSEAPCFVRTWQSDEGLPDNTVMGIDQTPDGFLWVATKTGLVRFDGLQFREFPTQIPGVVNEAIFALCADREGRLWVAKEQGVIICCEQGLATVVLAPDPSRPKRRIRMFVEDGEGAVWASLPDEGVLRIKEGKTRLYTTADGLPPGETVLVTVDQKGQLWFTRSGWVGVFKNDRFVTMREDRLKYISAASDKGVWLSTGDQIARCSEAGELSEVVELKPEIVKAGVTEILGDRSGRLWVGTRLAGLYCTDGTQTVKVETSQQTILCMKEDREGNIWVGTRGGGLQQVKPRVAELLTTSQGSPFEGIQSLCKDTKGQLWTVTWHKGSVMRNVNNAWEPLSANEGWTAADARCITADPSGGVWIGTISDGLFLWKDGVCINHLSATNGLAGHRVTAVRATPSGALWIGGRNNKTGDPFLQCWEAGSYRTLKLPPNSGDVTAMEGDAAGDCWIATSRGFLFKARGDVWTEQTGRLLPEPCPIRTLLATPDNSLWIGFSGMGLGRLKEGKFNHYRVAQGIHDDYISQMLSDASGRLWLAGNRGISSLRIKDLAELAAGNIKQVQAVTYKQKEGLPGLQASYDAWPSAFSDTEGRLYFAMQSGVVALYPDVIKADPVPPTVVIDHVEASGQTVALKAAGEVPAQIKPPLGERQIEFFFTAPSFTLPESIRFKYRLLGLDKEWVEAGPRRSVLYSQLAPGVYQFQVKACNREGVWSTQGASLALMIAPFWWETVWFHIGGPLVLFSLAGCLVVVWLRRRHRHQLERLELQQATEKERMRIAQDLHDDLGSNLAEIAMISELAQNELKPDDPSHQQFNAIFTRAENNVRRLSEIVWAINPFNDTLERFVGYLCKFSQDYLSAANVRCRLDIPENVPEIPFDSVQRHNLVLATKEAIHNAVRHGAPSEITIRLGVADDRVVVTVEDNGCGFDASIPVTPHRGTSNMTARMEKIGGTFIRRSVIGQGTIVTLAAPLKLPRVKL
jgi:ligand-binding sensor domain-containing protein/signal transduction histidine kinase